jgi:hypothetical protein
MAQPYDLATALSGQVAQPGDTFWLRGGNYALGHLDTTIAGAPDRPVTFRQLPGEQARIDGSLTIFDSPGHVIFMDFELYSSDTNRLSSQTGGGINPPPSDINAITGIACHVPNSRFINLVVRDHTRGGIYISEISTNTLVYGCVLYNNGWASPDNAEGHSVYVQSHIGTREIADNVAFNATGANFHIYESRGGGRLAGVTLDGNVAFNAGALQAVRRYPDWIIGVDAPAIQADQIVLKHNMGYFPPGSTAHDQVEIGREGFNGSVALLNNYLPLGLSLNNWTIAAVSANFFAAPTTTTNWIVSLNQSQVPLAAAWDNNSYLSPTADTYFRFNSNEYAFAGWQNVTGFDTNSTHTVGRLSGTKIFVRPNRFEPGRANIIVYNWDNLGSVAVDVSSVVAAGAAYEVRNAQDFFAPPVLRGVFDGEPLIMPMTGLTVAAPTGPLLTPPPTGPTFNVFILLPRVVRLGIAAMEGNVRISWPTNSGHWILQSAVSLNDSEGWSDDTYTPAVLGDQYVVTNPVDEQARFFRLRSQ